MLLYFTFGGFAAKLWLTVRQNIHYPIYLVDYSFNFEGKCPQEGSRDKGQKLRWHVGQHEPSLFSLSLCLNSSIKETLWLYTDLPGSFETWVLNVGHDKPVTSVSWSLCRQWWLSAAEDLSLRIWTKSSSEPAIILVINKQTCI